MAYGDQTDPILIKQNDTRPKIRYNAKQGPNQDPVNLTGANVVFNMRNSVAPNTVVASRVPAVVVTPATGGSMEATPTTAMTGANGLYQSEFEATFSDGGVLTFPPGDQYIWIRVGDDIA